jgi:hypothetical protein
MACSRSSRARPVALLALLALGCCGCVGEPPSAAQAGGRGERQSAASAPDDVYPSDITPPAGTQYPCALTALPHGLPGIPEADRAYLNRTYARILRATQAKLVLLAALHANRDLSAELASYQKATAALAARLADDQPPTGLAPFQQDVAEALALQQTFFAKAVPMRRAGAEMAEVYGIPEGRQASQRLMSAWSRMEQRYPSWSAATSDSIYHHLCALDLF